MTNSTQFFNHIEIDTNITYEKSKYIDYNKYVELNSEEVVLYQNKYKSSEFISKKLGDVVNFVYENLARHAYLSCDNLQIEHVYDTVCNSSLVGFTSITILANTSIIKELRVMERRLKKTPRYNNVNLIEISDFPDIPGKNIVVFLAKGGIEWEWTEISEFNQDDKQRYIIAKAEHSLMQNLYNDELFSLNFTEINVVTKYFDKPFYYSWSHIYDRDWNTFLNQIRDSDIRNKMEEKYQEEVQKQSRSISKIVKIEARLILNEEKSSHKRYQIIRGIR